jgi:hypothetical protein
MSDSNDDRLTSAVREALDRSARDLDPGTLRRLREARLAAVQVVESGRRRRHPSAWVPAGAFAMAALATVAIVAWPGAGRDGIDGDAAVAAVEDLDLLSAGDDVAIAEDVEFYQWLALIDEAG